jgi:hypothetical protein
MRCFNRWIAAALLNYLHLIRDEIHEWSFSLPPFTPSMHAVYILPYTELNKSQFTPQTTCIYKGSTIGEYELYLCVKDFRCTRLTLTIRLFPTQLAGRLLCWKIRYFECLNTCVIATECNAASNFETSNKLSWGRQLITTNRSVETFTCDTPLMYPP